MIWRLALKKMECPHLVKDFTALDVGFLKTKLKKEIKCSRKFLHGKLVGHWKSFNCVAIFSFAECDATDSIWICLTCGVYNCGRYVKAHGLTHYENQSSGHSVCMDCQELSVFW